MERGRATGPFFVSLVMEPLDLPFLDELVQNYAQDPTFDIVTARGDIFHFRNYIDGVDRAAGLARNAKLAQDVAVGKAFPQEPRFRSLPQKTIIYAIGAGELCTGFTETRVEEDGEVKKIVQIPHPNPGHGGFLKIALHAPALFDAIADRLDRALGEIAILRTAKEVEEAEKKSSPTDSTE